VTLIDQSSASVNDLSERFWEETEE